ncbi:LuxR family transcriptional regulator [Pseudomonas sp. R5(2019)]|nr:LuxR family transcriptional regulator [Pseudomonas sp. R5(2019)]
MELWTEDQLKQLMDTKNPEASFAFALSMAKQLGFEFMAFGMRTQVATMHPKVVIFNNYPSEWMNTYYAKNYITIDPVVIHCHTSLMPLLWSDETFKEAPAFWQEAQSHGLKFGWSQSARDYRGCESILSVARSEPPVSPQEFYEKSPHTVWLCNILHTLMSSHVSLNPEETAHLSEREIEVLKWSAMGKTAADIAIILRLSERTVNFHVKGAISKMNAANKTSAAVRAALGGLF